VRRVQDRNLFSRVGDREYLRAAVDALSGLLDDLGRPDGPDACAVRVRAACHRRWALERLSEVLVTAPARRPVVLDPADRASLSSVQGQPLTPMVTSGAADTTGLSSAQVWMPPRHVSHAHVHHHTDVGVVVLQGTAITVWWDRNAVLHELVQRPGQHLHIPFGVVHAAVNPFSQPVVAVEWRSNRIFNADNERVRGLDSDVQALMAARSVAA